jgi:hypothetical protein
LLTPIPTAAMALGERCMMFLLIAVAQRSGMVLACAIAYLAAAKPVSIA